MTLPEIRARIDALDSQLLELLNARADLVHEVGQLKKESGLEIYAPEREEQLLQSLFARNAGRLPEPAVRAIYREIMSASLALEKDLAIAYLGPEATWTHQAARGKFGASVRYRSQTTIADVFQEVARGTADYGVVPVENSTEGAVNYTLDLFMESDLLICAQILLKIENNLIARIPREQIRRVYSHPQVFGQCRQWVRHNLPKAELIEVSSTTRAAELAAQEADAAALAGRMAAEVYGLEILEAGVQDNPNNTTRFLVLGHHSCPPTGRDRTSIMFSLPDKPGALFAALRPFHDFGVSLTKIVSRPSRRKVWDYFFFVDVSGHSLDQNLTDTLAALQEQCAIVKVLGSYPEAGQLVN